MEVEEESKKLLTINTSQGLFQYNHLLFGVASGNLAKNDWASSWWHSWYQVYSRQDQVLWPWDRQEWFTQEKIDAVIQAPRPQNVTQVRSFLGLVNYYNHFLPNFSTVVQPLNNLLQRDHKWEWTRACEDAFEKSKELVASDQVLAHYDPDLPIKKANEAFPYGIGIVLSHVVKNRTERPIAFRSRSLTKTEQKYSQIDKEALALIWGIKKFHHYLFGRKFTISTDHQPLTQRQSLYALFLSGFDYDIVYKRTTQHINADCLPRLPLDTSGREERIRKQRPYPCFPSQSTWKPSHNQRYGKERNCLRSSVVKSVWLCHERLVLF